MRRVSLHVNMGKHDENTFITPLQRNRIAVKVKELIVATGRKQLDIYGDLLTEFGADNMDVFLDKNIKKPAPILIHSLNGRNILPSLQKKIAFLVKRLKRPCIQSDCSTAFYY
jgi:hypothetical protein